MLLQNEFFAVSRRLLVGLCCRPASDLRLRESAGLYTRSRLLGCFRHGSVSPPWNRHRIRRIENGGKSNNSGIPRLVFGRLSHDGGWCKLNLLMSGSGYVHVVDLTDLRKVVYGLETGVTYTIGAWWMGIANHGMTSAQREELDPASHEYYLRVGGSKAQLIGWILYTLLRWLTKLCMYVAPSKVNIRMLIPRFRVIFYARLM